MGIKMTGKNREKSWCGWFRYNEKCEQETKVLKGKAYWLDSSLREETQRLRTRSDEALSAIQANADVRTAQIESETIAVTPQSVKFRGLQALLSIVDLPPEGGPIPSSSHRITTPCHLCHLLKQSNF
jgi:hypothetical protein